MIIANNGRTNWVFNTSTGTDRMYTFEGRQYLADTPTGHFVMNRQIDGVRVGQLGTLYRPKYFHPDGIAFHGYTSVPPYPGVARLRAAHERGDQLRLGRQHHSARYRGLGVLTRIPR